MLPFKKTLQELTQQVKEYIGASFPPPDLSTVSSSLGSHCLPAQEAYETTTLANGVTLTFLNFPKSLDLNCAVNVRASPRTERASELGYAHFLEHMMLEDTSPIGDFFSRLKATPLGCGSYASGCTIYDSTYFEFALPKSKALEGLRIIAHEFAQPSFDDAAVSREQRLIFSELRGSHSTFDRLNEKMLAAIYRDGRLATSILGNSSSLKNVTREGLLKFFQEAYSANQTTVYIAGDIDPVTKNRCCEYFSQLPNSLSPREAAITDTAWEDPAAPRFLTIPKPTTRALCKIMFPGPVMNSTDRIVNSVLADIMRYDLRSPLNQRLRLDTGLSYHTEFKHTSHIQGQSLNTINLRLPLGSWVPKALDQIKRTISELTENPIPEQLVEASKTRKIGNVATWQSGVIREVAAMNRLGSRHVITPEIEKEIISRITPSDIQRLARYVFSDAYVGVAGKVIPGYDYGLAL